MKIAKSPNFISFVHIGKGDLGPTPQIALLCLPCSLVLCIQFGCNSSPLYVHTLQRSLWTWFSHACELSETMQTLHWFWSKKQPGPKPKGYCGNTWHWLAKPHLIVMVTRAPQKPSDSQREFLAHRKKRRCQGLAFFPDFSLHLE